MEDSYVLQLLKPKFKEFYLCFCGYADCKPLHSYGPATRANYIIHYIIKGKGTYQIGERKYHLSEGQGFLIEPEVLTFYQADKDDPWTYLWIGFDGSDARKRIGDIGLNSRQLTFQCGYGEELKTIVLDMLKHIQSTTSNLYYLQGMLYQFFSVLTRDIVVDSLEDESRENRYVMEAIDYIRNHYSDGIGVEDVAEAIHVSRNYLYMVFKNKLDLSPKEFLTDFRISRAKEQLALTELSIEQVAASCGYKNTLVFSRAFKQVLGFPPSQYRKERRKEVKDSLIAGQEELEKIKHMKYI